MNEYEVIKNRVVNIISEYTEMDIKELTDEKKLVADIGLSSFDIFFLVSEIEKNLEIQIEMNEEFTGITTLEELYQFIIKQKDDKKEGQD